MDIKCPNCNKILVAKPEHIGQTAECPACGCDVEVRLDVATKSTDKEFDFNDYQRHQQQHECVGINSDNYAGFIKRFAAQFIDGILLAPLYFIIGMMLMPVSVMWVRAEQYAVNQSQLTFMFQSLFFLVYWLYHALMESSPKQATLGKLALGIRVVDIDRNRVSFLRASGRHFAKLISNMTFLVGYAMAGFTKKKQALHDMVAECLVVNK